MAHYKVEICGINTSKLPLLSNEEKKELSFRDMLPVALAAMMESAAELSFVKDKHFHYMCCSRAFAKLAGLKSEKDIVGKTDYDLFDPTQADRYRETTAGYWKPVNLLSIARNRFLPRTASRGMPVPPNIFSMIRPEA